MSAAANVPAGTQAAPADAEDRLRRAEHLASLNTLLGGIAHNLGNPLTTIRTFVELLPERWESDAEFREGFYSLVVAELDRVQQLVTSMARWSVAPEAGDGPWAVAELVEELEAYAAGVASRKDLRFRSDHGTLPGRIMAPQEVFRQALTVLLDNAVAFSPECEEVVLRIFTSPETEEVVAEVLDAGPGVALERREEIFEAFVTTRPGGTGIGLFVARCLARAHGGEVEVVDGPSGGGLFRLRLPAIAVSARGAT